MGQAFGIFRACRCLCVGLGVAWELHRAPHRNLWRAVQRGCCGCLRCRSLYTQRHFDYCPQVLHYITVGLCWLPCCLSTVGQWPLVMNGPSPCFACRLMGRLRSPHGLPPHPCMSVSTSPTYLCTCPSRVLALNKVVNNGDNLTDSLALEPSDWWCQVH